MDKLFASFLATKISAAVKCHKHQFGFCGQKVTADASFNFVMAILERRSDKERTYAFELDMQRAFSTPNRGLMLLKLRQKDCRAPMAPCVAPVHLTESQVTLGGQSSAYFPILEGVVQGCLTSPILFNSCVDDLLNAQHRACQLHGIPPADCQDKLSGQAYADDTKALSLQMNACNT
jgi:hypothetical protein